MAEMKMKMGRRAKIMCIALFARINNYCYHVIVIGNLLPITLPMTFVCFTVIFVIIIIKITITIIMDGGQKGCALNFLPALRIQIWPQAGRGWAGKGAWISSQSENLATNFRGRGGERRKEWFMDINGIRFGDKMEGRRMCHRKRFMDFFRIRNWDKI